MKRGFWGTFSGRALLAALCLFLFSAVTIANTMVVLPFSNVDGRSTVRTIVNNTDQDIALPFVNPGCGQYCVVPKVKARSFDTAPVTTPGEGVFALELSDGLEAYVDITTASGQFTRAYPLTPFTTAYFYDLFKEGRFNGGLFIAASLDADAVVQIVGGDAFRLRAGEGRVASTPGAIAIVTNSWSGVGAPGLPTGKLYGFAFINDQRTGAIQFVPAR